MNEETLFTAALEKETKADRMAFIAQACAGNEALRLRLEALLASHEQAEFLRTSAAERAAIEFGGEVTRPACEPAHDCPLDFLVPSEKPGSLGLLGHYEVQEVIGRGGMGIVLRAFDERLHRVVAIKVISPELATSAAARRRFAREAQAAAAVSHDHVVSIFAVEESGHLPYLVMQYVAGVSLQERIEKHGPLQVHEILRIGMQAASGLAAAHAQGLIHRDIKPANILLENGVERVKLTDFGLARAVDDASLTQSGVVAGTPQYMAPEQARGESVDQRADLFSLGSVIYAMCTGRAPFRASGTLAMLKRVCEEPPSPIQSTNPSIPDWLIAIVAKLHAKDPDDRFQSAAEVADVLAQYLAHVQHPTAVPLPRIVSSPQKHAWKRRRWMAAALALLTGLCGLGFAEAVGVTHLTSTVIRILTPDGILVVETSDPDVHVTIEGDGGLSITGAGPREVRLRPGSYQVRASKDGRPVRTDRDLVTIKRDDKQVVRVRLERGADAVARSESIQPSAERGAFVVLEKDTRPQRQHDTLVEAIEASHDGDTIEIRGQGPFVIPHLEVRHALAIRAAKGFRPVLTDTPETRLPGSGELILAKAPFTLEGLVIHSASAAYAIIQADDLFYAANCRFEIRGAFTTCIAGSMTCLRNCEVYAPDGAPLGIECYGQRSSFIVNSVLVGHVNFTEGELKQMAVLRLERSTLISWTSSFLHLLYMPRGQLDEPQRERIRVFCSENVFDSPGPVYTHIQPMELGPIFSTEQAKAWLRRRMDWRESRNVYRLLKCGMLGFELVQGKPTPAHCMTIGEWEEFWDLAGTASVIGDTRFEGGNLVDKSKGNLDALQPTDFRLTSGSAGYRAGPDGKDLGADVDLVGPGAAYERWKLSPEYQEWVDQSGQRQSLGQVVEKQAFVLLGGKGVAERKLNTLAEAVTLASNGDTIEIRGNGPFVTHPVSISGQFLTIRAGEGFRPVIVQSGDTPPDANLIQTDAPLILEGLEIRRPGNGPPGNRGSGPFLVLASGDSLSIANCRLLSSSKSTNRNDLLGLFANRIHVRNCELFSPCGIALSSRFGAPITVTIENNLMIGSTLMDWWVPEPPKPNEARVRFSHNTLIADRDPAIYVGCPAATRALISSPNAGRVVFESSGNVFDVFSLLALGRHEWKLGTPEEDRSLFKALLGWSDRDNVYELQSEFLFTSDDTENRPLAIKTPADWAAFWGNPEARTHEGTVHYLGGNLAHRLRTTPEQLAPSDFRLRADSAGYRAGPDGKDLGADVDLVGPGAAYERWKKTPEYLKWLEETRSPIQPEG